MSLFEKVKNIIDKLADDDFEIEFETIYCAFMEGFVNQKNVIPGLDNIEFERIKQIGGEEQGSTYYSIYKFTDTITNEIIFIKFNGWYASYVGAEYQNMFEVKPVEKTIIDYISV